MAEEAPSEKSFRDWLEEALARDQQTWDALEEKLEKIRTTGRRPRPAERPAKPLDW